MSYRVYGLRPDRRFVDRCDDLETAKDAARDLVNARMYDHAEVWNARRPIFGVWLTGETKRRLHTTDDEGPA